MIGLIFLFLIILALIFIPMFPKCGKCQAGRSTVDKSVVLHKAVQASPPLVESVYTPGTMPTFGLWTTLDRLNSPDCRYRPPFQYPNPPMCSKSEEAKRFPIDCTSGSCRIRSPLEDSIYLL